MLLLLPPSESKAPLGSGTWNPAAGAFGASLGAARLEVAAALAHTAPRALGLKGMLATHATAINAGLVGASVFPAYRRYTGVVATHLSAATMSTAGKRRARSSVLFVSGLGGLFFFNEPVPDYRAPMTASIEGLGPLSTFWAPRLAGTISALHRRGPILDLLPNAHRRAIGDLGPRRLIVDLTRDGHVGGHDAKAAKGRLARALLEEGPVALSTFAFEDWRAIVT